MEHQVQAFTNFVPGNHLVLGAAGVGKTRLIWSLLQTEEFSSSDSINIFLTDSAKRLRNHNHVSVIQVDPYSTDMNWIAEPDKPGIYYAACDYFPRVITFLECLANYARRYEGNISHPIRIFVDFPSKFWKDNCFIDQLARLQYISESFLDESEHPIDIWMVLTPEELGPKTQSLFQNTNFLILNPMTESLKQSIEHLLGKTLPELDHLIEDKKMNGFYYMPLRNDSVYLQDIHMKLTKENLNIVHRENKCSMMQNAT